MQNEMEQFEITFFNLGGFVHLYDGRNQGSPHIIYGIYIYF
jgi:hypothetical protein